MEFSVGFRIIYTATILYRSHVFLTIYTILFNIITIILDPMGEQSCLYGLTELGVFPTSFLSSSFLFYIEYYVCFKCLFKLCRKCYIYNILFFNVYNTLIQKAHQSVSS